MQGNIFVSIRILVLEDDTERVKQFKQRMLPNWFVDYVATASEAISLLSKQEYDWIFLDHDLGGMAYVNSAKADTGAEVARWLAANKTKATVIIHSFNEDGAAYMGKLLPSAKWMPGIWTAGNEEFYEQLGR